MLDRSINIRIACIGALCALDFVSFGAGVFWNALPHSNEREIDLGGFLSDAANEINTVPEHDIGSGSKAPSFYEIESLKSQRTVAEWTRRTGQAAIIGAILSSLGIWLIWRTWKATREAAAISQKTYETFISLERAILVPKVQLEDEDQKDIYGINILVTNIGKTSCVVEKVDLTWIDEARPVRPTVTTGWPTHELIKPSATGLSHATWAKRSSRSGNFLSGKISYRSPLGMHESWFCKSIIRVTSENGMDMLLMHDAKDETWPSDT